MHSILLTLSVVIALAVFLAWITRKRRKSASKTPYVDALHLLLDGRRDEALEQLKKTVRTDTENIMAYIKLGDIFRDKGYPIRASKIHRNLLLRTTLTEEQNEETLFHLILDYRAADMVDKAVEMAERLMQKNKKNIEIRKLLLELYEEKKDWDKAFFMRQGINKWIKGSDQAILALYKVNAGRELTGRGSEHQGRIRFREAIKLDRACAPAVMELGDSYVREKRLEDALKVWKDWTGRVPHQAHLLLDRLNDILYSLGRYSELEPICEQIIRSKPSHPGATFRLIDIYEKQGRLTEALDLARHAVEAFPDSARGRWTLVRLLARADKTAEALDTALSLLSLETEQAMDYKCVHCGRSSQSPFWRCPGCKRWHPMSAEKP
ncbi:tetratricopeptide repeat protein [bacterium]|nr:tetratricopeptide repeat protein [bacterium]